MHTYLHMHDGLCLRIRIVSGPCEQEPLTVLRLLLKRTHTLNGTGAEFARLLHDYDPDYKPLYATGFCVGFCVGLKYAEYSMTYS